MLKRNRRAERHSNSEPEQVPRMLSVYDGTKHLGFLALRGRNGVEAFTADNKSLGLFIDQKSAIDAVGEAAS